MTKIMPWEDLNFQPSEPRVYALPLSFKDPKLRGKQTLNITLQEYFRKFLIMTFQILF